MSHIPELSACTPQRVLLRGISLAAHRGDPLCSSSAGTLILPSQRRRHIETNNLGRLCVRKEGELVDHGYDPCRNRTEGC